MKVYNYLLGLLSVITLSSINLLSQVEVAQPEVLHSQYEQKKLFGEYIRIKESGGDLYIPKRNKDIQPHTEGGACTVSFTLDQTSDTYRSGLAVYGDNLPEPIVIREFSSIGMATCKLPRGTYTMYAYYFSKDKMRFYIVFKDNVLVRNNVSIDFDVQEANLLTTVKTYDEKSTQLKADVKKEDELLQQGNCRHLSTDVFFVHKKHGNIMTLFGRYYTPEYDFGIYTNSFGGNISFCATVKGIKKDDASRYFLSYSTDKAGQTLENNPKNYAQENQRFEPTKIGRGYISIASPAYSIWSVYDSGALANSFMFDYDFIVKDKTVSFWYDLPKSKDGKFMTLVAPAFLDQRTAIPSTQGARWDYRYIVGLPILGDASGTEYVNFGYELWLGYSMLQNGKQKIYPGHPVFSFTKKQGAFEYGNSCPILSIITIPDKKTILLTYTYLGRYGEVRQTDAKEESSLHQNKVVEGDVVHHVITNTNVQVDNASGYNETTLDYNTSRSDFVPPVLQMLRFVDSKGIINDHFESGSEGYVEFAAGDFDHIDNGKGLGYWECKQNNVEAKLYYSEHGSNRWRTLDIDLIPSNYWAQGFGDFFRGELSQVAGKGGWFDLLVDLKDLSNNTQKQILSPAFYIENPTFTYPVLASSEFNLRLEDHSIVIEGLTNPQVVVYNNGGVVRIDKKGNKIPVSDLIDGVYIVKVIGEGNTFVKKIVLSD